MTLAASLFERDSISTVGGTSEANVQTPAVATFSAPAISNAALLPSIIPYDVLLETFLAARKVGAVFPYLVRQTVFVPAGSIGELVTTIPPGDTASVVYLLELRANIYSSEFLVSLKADNLPPFFVEIPMIEPLDVLGSFLVPVQTMGIYELVNNSTEDITFIANVQLAVMTHDFAKHVYGPITRGQYHLLEEAAANLHAAQKKVSA